VDEPADAMLRVSLEPCGGEPGARDVTLWLAAWGGADLGAIEREWSERLVRLFPEGTTPVGS
jgi:hypothetical protein